MELFENFFNLFSDVWQQGVAGSNITEIIIALLIFFIFDFKRIGFKICSKKTRKIRFINNQ